MTHIVLHLIVPLLVALTFYRDRWGRAFLILVATMLVDADHLLASPVYDPDRCSLGFHPLHTVPALAIYTILFALPLLLRRRDHTGSEGTLSVIHLIGLGLLIHMALDGIDCVA